MKVGEISLSILSFCVSVTFMLASGILLVWSFLDFLGLSSSGRIILFREKENKRYLENTSFCQ